MSSSKSSQLGIWMFAAGYFACYVPYSAVAKGTSSGLLPGLNGPTSGLATLPVIAVSALIGLIAAMFVCGWWDCFEWKRVGSMSLPLPRQITLGSGIATGVTGITTTLAYTFEGVSIVFMMLLMRGGVLAMAPLIDVLVRRRVRWFSVVALLCCLGALVAAFLGRSGFSITILALIDVGFYLLAYFFRLQWMSKLGKFPSIEKRRRYFVEEQWVSSIVIVGSLCIVALINHGEAMAELHHGFSLFRPDPLFAYLVVVGFAAQGAGIFGSLVLLDPRENSFAVPVNRASSIVSGMVATLMLAVVVNTSTPTLYEWIGAAFIVIAIGFLTVPPFLARRRC